MEGYSKENQENLMCDIPIKIERGSYGLFYGTSTAVKGLLVVGDSPEQVRERAPRAIAEMRSVAAYHSAIAGVNSGDKWDVIKFSPDWKLTPVEQMAVKLTLALAKHIPGWPGATDEQLQAVVTDILAEASDENV
jgi:hypothetical protein